MSKTLDYLKKIQGVRENKRQSGSAPITSPANKYAEAVNIAQDHQEGKTPRKVPALNKILLITLCALISISIGINAIAIFSIKSTSHEKKSTVIRIAEIEQALNKAIKKLDTQGADIKQTNDSLSSINSKLKDTNRKVTLLEKDIIKTQESARFDIESLNKAKNTILNKISILTEKIDEIKSAKKQ